MAKCHNRNTPAFQALYNEFGNNQVVSGIINRWQEKNKSEEIPSVVAAQEIVKESDKVFKKEKETFAKAIMGNLSKLGLVTQFNNKYYIANSNPITQEFDEDRLTENLNRVQRYLEIKNIPTTSAIIRRSPESYQLQIDSSQFTSQDLLQESRDNDGAHVLDVIDHLAKMFPNIDITVVSEQEAKEHYNSLEDNQKANVPFEEIKSYYVDDKVMLINGRVNTETTIEEILHPFVDALYIDNKSLFNGLLKEAKNTFPVLSIVIENAYSDGKGFSQVHRDLELVTQALSRHFKKEFEEKPSATWTELIADALRWLYKVVNNLYKYITGKNISVSDIKSRDSIYPYGATTFTDIAKLLNTKELTFNLKGVRVDNKVRYRLTPEKQLIVDNALDRANDAQREVIKRMFHMAMTLPQEIGRLSVSKKEILPGDKLVVLNKAGEDHKYFEVGDGKNLIEYMSMSQAIKGKFEDSESKKINLDVGNDFDALVDGIVAGLELNQVIGNMTVISAKDAEKAWYQLEGVLFTMTRNDQILIPQVTFYDSATKKAGTADVVMIDTEGKIGIIDLKTSIRTIRADYYKDQPHLLADDSLLKIQGDYTELSTRGQHGVQVNSYRRMAENMGYKMMRDEFGAVTTIHLLVDIGVDKETGKKVYKGFKRLDGFEHHDVSENAPYVNVLIPSNVSARGHDWMMEVANKAGTEPAFNTVSNPDIDPPLDTTAGSAYDVILGRLRVFETGVLKREQAIEKSVDSISHAMTKEETLKDLVMMTSGIEVAIHRGSDAVSREYTKLLQKSLREIEAFVEYAQDPTNLETENQERFISIVLNFDKFISTYRGLIGIKDSGVLNKNQSDLLVNLMTQLNNLEGNKHAEYAERGVISQAIYDYVKSLVGVGGAGLSNREFTEEQLDKLLTLTDDISLFEASTYDLDTSSDTLSALIAKIWKRKRQLTLDLVDERDNKIRIFASNLLRLSPGSKVDYGFMIQFDEKGENTGYYVRKIGYDYWRQRNELRQRLTDVEGNWKQYIYIQTLANSRPQDIEFNKQLYKDRRAYGQFLTAEIVGDNGKEADGEFHKYTQEFKDLRKKYEKFVSVGDYPQWEKRQGISDEDWQKYKAENYDVKEVDFAVKDYADKFIGKTVKRKIRVVKKKNTEIRDVSSRGQEMRDPKWIKIMSPTNSLEEAQRDFYLMFREEFEEKLLKKLPMSVRGQMLGKMPLVMGTLMNTVKEQPNIVSTLWGKAVNSVKNFYMTTNNTKRVVTDEQGNFVDSLPIWFAGRPRSDEALKEISVALVSLLEDFKSKKIDKAEYKMLKADLEGKRQKLLTQPTRQEISQDLADSLLKFSAMAENYEVMESAKDTFTAIIKVMEDRQYNPDKTTTMVANVKGLLTKVGVKGTDSDNNTVKRVKKWMKMVYYDNDNMTKNMFDKISDYLIQHSSLSYVAFNVFGNLNNYTIARLNNAIETVGGRFYDAKAMRRATVEFNLRALPDMARRTAFMANSKEYDKYTPESKWEVLVATYRMMDKKGDLREEGSMGDDKGWFMKIMEWGYLFQDSGEYNVQSKVGMAILMSQQIMNSKTKETKSLYDAYQLNGDGTATLEPGYDTLIETDSNGKTAKETPFSNLTRWDIRNKIREVNKQIHGNYAYEDRMAMQSHALGQLAAQFHKWVIPAIKARFRPEYFDENVGWLEGRYRSAWNFMHYTTTHLGEINKWFSKDGFREWIKEGTNKEADDQAYNKLLNVYRTLGEIGIMMTSFAMITIFSHMFEDDDDDSETVRRLENALIYQADRTYKELIQFVPIHPHGMKQIYQMIKSPIAATRTLGELGEAISASITDYPAWLIMDKDKFYADKDYVYQKGPRAKRQELKVNKQWKDAVPILYSIQRWQSYDREKSFFIK